MEKEYAPADKKYLVSLGKTIMGLAGKNGTSFERLAYESEVSKTYFYKILHGETNPTILVLRRIAAALEMDVWKLIKMVEDN